MIPEEQNHWRQPALGQSTTPRPPGMEMDPSKIEWLTAPDGSYVPVYAGFPLLKAKPQSTTTSQAPATAQPSTSTQPEHTPQPTAQTSQGYYTSAEKMPNHTSLGSRPHPHPQPQIQQTENLIDIAEEDMELEERGQDRTVERTGEIRGRGRSIDERLQGLNPDEGMTLADAYPRYPERGEKSKKSTETRERYFNDRDRDRRRGSCPCQHDIVLCFLVK